MTQESVAIAVRESGACESPASGATAPPKLDESLDRLERELIVNALRATRGNQAKAARLLGVTERVMGLRVRKHGLDCWAFRATP